MRDFKFICKRCEHRIQTRTIYAGELIACPVCEGEIVIPQPPRSPGDPLPVAYPPGESPASSVTPKPDKRDKPLRPPGDFSPFAGGYEFQVPVPVPPPGVFEPEVPDSPASDGLVIPPSQVVEPEPEAAVTGPADQANESPAPEPPREESAEGEGLRPPTELPQPEPSLEGPGSEPEFALTDPQAEPPIEESPLPREERAPDPASSPEIGSQSRWPQEAQAAPPAEEAASLPPMPVPAMPDPVPRPAPVSSPSPFAPRPESTSATRTPPAPSPFGPVPSAGPKPAATPEREGPHTGVLMLAINVLIVLIVVAVVLIPRNGKGPSGPPDAALDSAKPTVPDWPSIPEPDATPVVPGDAAARVEQAINGLLGSLARNDLLGAARWIVPTATLREVTNRLASLTVGGEGGTNVAWRLLAPISASPGGLAVVVRVGGQAGHRLELDFQNTSVGWRVGRLQWSGTTNEPPVNVDFVNPLP
ncbi:MAG: hypothetical protein H7A46_06770 [Verrucomicrobiales bacterium]|nr:hypothetical protein [Verrucomicrobiales bacterium]